MLSGADPLTAVVDRRSVGEPLGHHAPTDAISRLEHHDVVFPGDEITGRDEPRNTAADNADVALEGLVRHGSNGTSPRYGASMPLAAPLVRAESALLDERRALKRAEALDVARLPLEQVTDLVALAHRVRLEYCGDEVELESLINAKSGACPEDCAFCSQSARFATDVDVYPFLDLDEVVGAARATREAGATQFCIVVAVRGPEERLLRKVINAVDAVHRETGLEVACSLGLLRREQAERLAEAGVRRYNHNLETCREMFPQICTTHTYDDRVETARLAIDAGMELCCGGILGMGETLEQRVDFAFELAELGPCEVPVNFLLPTGTPLGEHRMITAREALQAIALFRLVLPSAWLRLAGGREFVLGELQAMGLLAGANALIVGNYLTTGGRPAADDLALLDALGMPVADGPGEGRFVVDGDGGHALPARRSSQTIPVRAR